MKKTKRQKTRNIFLSVVLLSIVIAVTAWFYISIQQTTLSIEANKVNYFAIEQPEITVKILNPKNATSGEIVIDYPEENLIFQEADFSKGVSMREIEGELYFELSPEFFENDEKNIGTMKFDISDTGIININANEEKSFLDTPEGKLEFKQFDNSSFNIGLPKESEEPEVQENAGTFEGV